MRYVSKVSRQLLPQRGLQLIHSDVVGFIEPAIGTDEKYFLTFIHDFTAFKMVYIY